MHSKYQVFADNVRTELINNTSWIADYNRYADNLLANEQRIKEARKKFHKKPPLYPYLTIGSVNKRAITFNMRFLGQSIGDLQCGSNSSVDPELSFEITNTQAENSLKYFGKGEEKVAFTKAGKYNWVGKEAANIRRDFAEQVRDDACFPRQREHMVESALFSELEKTNGIDKALKWIQPISYAGTRIHMKTAVSASKSKDNQFEVGKGGEIDLFCRRKKGHRTYLMIIEIKDENKGSEPPEKAIKQAIAYTVFIRELLRSNSGDKWRKLWGVENQHWEEKITLYAAVAMPQKDGEDLSFANPTSKDHIIKIDNDEIELHYISFIGDLQPKDGKSVKLISSIDTKE